MLLVLLRFKTTDSCLDICREGRHDEKGCCAQEYFVEDMIELLLYVSRFKPMVLEGLPMEELLLFFVTFMGSPDFVHNPYLRSRMVEVRLRRPVLYRCI